MTAPAEMPGVYRIADEFERELFAWRNLPSRDGAALRACAYALAQKAETLFAPILAEKERLAGIADAYTACESVARKRVDHIEPSLEERLPALCEISRETWLAHKERAPIMAVDMLEHAKRKALEARALAAEAALAAEKERCAKVAEGVSTFEWRGGDEWASGYVDGKNAAAAAIRAEGE